MFIKRVCLAAGINSSRLPASKSLLDGRKREQFSMRPLCNETGGHPANYFCQAATVKEWTAGTKPYTLTVAATI
jgi:hypothetical protein